MELMMECWVVDREKVDVESSILFLNLQKDEGWNGRAGEWTLSGVTLARVSGGQDEDSAS